MEKSLNFEENLTRNIWQNLELAQVEPRQLSPLVLAYIGDSIYGRNAKSYTSAKNATIGDYRRATGFEALMGYLYLDGQYDRLTKLVHTGLEAIGEWEQHRMEKK